jgi:hypothetical protein
MRLNHSSRNMRLNHSSRNMRLNRSSRSMHLNRSSRSMRLNNLNMLLNNLNMRLSRTLSSLLSLSRNMASLNICNQLHSHSMVTQRMHSRIPFMHQRRALQSMYPVQARP